MCSSFVCMPSHRRGDAEEVVVPVTPVFLMFSDNIYIPLIPSPRYPLTTFWSYGFEEPSSNPSMKTELQIILAIFFSACNGHHLPISPHSGALFPMLHRYSSLSSIIMYSDCHPARYAGLLDLAVGGGGESREVSLKSISFLCRHGESQPSKLEKAVASLWKYVELGYGETTSLVLNCRFDSDALEDNDDFRCFQNTLIDGNRRGRGLTPDIKRVDRNSHIGTIG